MEIQFAGRVMNLEIVNKEALMTSLLIHVHRVK